MKPQIILQHDETDCAAACLASIMKYYGKRIAINRIRKAAGTDNQGTSGLGIVRAAETFGFTCKGLLSKEKNINQDLPCPFIAHVKQDVIDHYVVVYKINQKVLVGDPATGFEKLSLEEFKSKWSGVFFILSPTSNFVKVPESQGLFSRFMHLLVPHKKTLVLTFIASLCLTVLGVATAFYFRFLIDEVLYSQLETSLTLFSLGYLLVIIFQGLLDFSRSQIMMYMSNKIDMVLICGYFNHILHLPMQFFTSRKTGEILSRLNDTATIRQTISSTTLSVVLDSCMLVFGGFFLFIFGNSLIFVAVLPVIISSVIAWLFLKPYKTKIRKKAVMEAEKHSTLVESINGIATIKALSTEKSTYERAEGQIIETIYRGISLGKMSNAQRTLQNFVSQCGTLAIYWIGSLYIFDGSMSLGQLISFVTLSGYFLGPFARLLMLQPALQESFVASDRLSEILDMPEENENTENLVKLDSVDSFKGNIKVENLSFSYGTRGKTLDGISFDIKGGQKVAFVGLSGSGKTTMTKLLLKFYDYSEGEIFIDGMSLKDIDTLSLRKITGYVPQEVLLFSGTILENIALGTEGATYKEILDSSKASRADEFISRLPERYLTKVGERGATLSGGERQRLSLARILLRKPKLIILDEATASLDVVTEKAIMDTLNNTTKGVTTIIVAHRLSTICDCDKIFVFDKGQIVESGSHIELLSRNGKYKKMWDTQHQGEYEYEKPSFAFRR